MSRKCLNSFDSESRILEADINPRSAFSMHYFDSVLVIEDTPWFLPAYE